MYKYENEHQAVDGHKEHMINQEIKNMKNIDTTVTPVRKVNDPFQTLPFDITTNIVTLLPQDTRIECLSVSSLWRLRILESPKAWRTVTLQRGQKIIPFVHIASILGDYVEDLSINTTSETVCGTFIEEIRKGKFKRIQSLAINASRINDFQSYTFKTIIGLMRVQDTLTKLDIDITGIQQDSITIPSILSFCNNLTDLVFSSKAEPLAVKLKTFTEQIKHYPSLVNLELISNYINGRDIEPIIQRCQQLRRLVLSGCDDSVLDALVHNSTPNLELFSYNDEIDGPPLPMLQEKKTTTNNNSHNKIETQREENQYQQGLRVIYTSYGETSVRPEKLIPLIYKNRKTLENIRACMSHLRHTQLRYLYEKYPDFKLKNIKHLSTWLSPGIQQFMLRKIIQNSNTLSTLVAVGDYNMNLLLKALINRTPLLGLNISHVYDSTNDVTRLLIQLFAQYAKSSKGNRSDSSLNWIKLRYCNQVTDDVLKKLSGIKTLHDIHFGGLNNISNDGILQFINTLENQITHVFLHDMDLVNDNIIIALGDLDNLLLVKLELLRNVTDKGLRTLVDNKKRKSRRLMTLEVTECGLISQEFLSYAQKNVKTVRYNSPHSEYYVTKAKDNVYISRSALLL